jgi:hypothetical protein
MMPSSSTVIAASEVDATEAVQQVSAYSVANGEP